MALLYFTLLYFVVCSTALETSYPPIAGTCREALTKKKGVFEDHEKFYRKQRKYWVTVKNSYLIQSLYMPRAVLST
jgi:hypothetical protein